MTSRKLALSLGVALACAVFGQAQAMRTERHAYALAASQRLDLLDAWLAATPERQRAAAAGAAKPNDGNPYLTLAAARAALAGSTAPSVPEILRASLAVFALPEVCDGERFPAVHVTLHAPRGLPVAIDGLAFDLELVDGAGAIVASASLGDAVGSEDLMRFRATAPLAFGSAAPGRFEVRVFARAAAFARTPIATSPVLLEPGFPARADALPMLLDGSALRVASADAIVAGLPEAQRSGPGLVLLRALVHEVERAYSGEPRRPGADPRRDLERAEAALAALRADRDPWSDLRGRVTVSVPIGEFAGRQGELVDFALVSIDCGEDGLARLPQRPLVLVVPGVPAWSIDAARPASPQTLHPAWTVDALRRAGFDQDGHWHVAVMESPGRFRSASGAVRDVLRGLRQSLPVDPARIALVGEREGGYAAARAALEESGSVRCAVLVDGGAVAAAELAAHDALHVAYAISVGNPAQASLVAMAKAAAATGRAHVLPDSGAPWCIALGAHAASIAAFLQARFAP